MGWFNHQLVVDLGVSKNRGTPKWMGENNGKPYFSMDDLGKPFIFGNTHLQTTYRWFIVVVTQHTHYWFILKLVFLLNWLLCLANEQVGWRRKSGPTRRFKRSSKSRLYTCSTKTLMNSLVERIKLVQKNAQTVHCSEFFVKIKRSTSNTKKQIRYHQITFEKVHVQKLNLFAPEKGRFSAPKRNWSHLRYNHHFSVCVWILCLFFWSEEITHFFTKSMEIAIPHVQ